MRTKLTMLLLVSGCVCSLPSASAGATITLDFDSVSFAPGTCGDASAYLSSFGVSFISVSGGASPVICNAAGTAATPASSPNVFYAFPTVLNTDESYDLLFSTPLTQLSFTRAAIAPQTALPPWDAFAYDASDNLLSSVVQPLMFPGPPAATFTLSGPGIVRLHVDSLNSAHVTFSHPPIDDLTLTTETVPEPATLLLLGTGLICAARARRQVRPAGRSEATHM